MFDYWVDPQAGPQYRMKTEWYEYFLEFFEDLNELRETRNKNWSSEELESYLKCLNDIENYIRAYIFTQIQVVDYNVFEQTM